MLTLVLLVTLSADPAVSSRIDVCGPIIQVERTRPRILSRTAPEFDALVVAPSSFREEASGDRPRSFATIACSPAVCDDFQGPDRFPRYHPPTARARTRPPDFVDDRRRHRSAPTPPAPAK
jgi:hypothetical protein